MPYVLSWNQPQRIAFVRFNGDLSADELTEFSENFVAHYLSPSIVNVHLISDIRAMGKFPTRMAAVRQATEIFLKHDRMGVLVVIGSMHPLTKFLISIVTQLIGNEYRLVDTEEDALTTLYRFDNSLSTNNL